MGKGSNRRPAQVDDDVVAENWARTFGKALSVEVVDVIDIVCPGVIIWERAEVPLETLRERFPTPTTSPTTPEKGNA